MLALLVLSFIAAGEFVSAQFGSAGPGYYFVLMHFDLALVWLLLNFERTNQRRLLQVVLLSSAALSAAMMVITFAALNYAGGWFSLYNTAYDVFGPVSILLTTLEVLALFGSNFTELACHGCDAANYWFDRIRRLCSVSLFPHSKR